MTRRIHSVLIGLSLLLFALALTSCDRENAEPQTTTVIAMLPLTGDLAFLGEPGKAALAIAQEELMGHDIQIAFTPVDSKASPNETVTAMQQSRDLFGRSIFFVTLTGPALAAREYFAHEDVVLVAIAIHPELATAASPLVQFCANARQEAELLIEELVGTKNPIGLVLSKDAATEAQVQRFILPALEAAGKPIAFVEWFDVGQKSFDNLTARFNRARPREVLLLGYGSDFPAALEALRVTGHAEGATVFGGIGFVEMTERPAGLETTRFRFVVPAFSVGGGGPSAQTFRAAYRSRTGREPPYDAAFTYDAAMTIGDLLRKGHRTPTAILDELRGHSFEGVTGTITLDANGGSRTDLRWATFGADGIQEEQR